LSALGSLFLLRSGFLGILFLVPLGISGCIFGAGAIYRGAFLAVLFNILLVLVSGRGFGEALPDLGFFFITAASFTWLMAPGILRVRAAYRFSLGALAGALTGIGFFLAGSPALGDLIRFQAEFLSSLAAESASGDAVRRSLLEQELNPQRLMEIMRMILLRGGAVVSLALILFLNRQCSRGIAALVSGRRGFSRLGGSALRDFHAPPYLIWVLSGSLGGILLFSMAGLSPAETVLWNILILCGLMYLAQGFGILQFLLSRRAPPLRGLLNAGIVLAILSPGINAAALVLLMLLGIAEYWAPLRRPSGGQPGDPPTPAG
jgi:hypothetical protein